MRVVAIVVVVSVGVGIPPPKNGFKEHIVAPVGLDAFVSFQSLADVAQIVVQGHVTHLVDAIAKTDTVLERQLVQELGNRQGFSAVLGHGCGGFLRNVVGGGVFLHQLHSPQVIANGRVENQDEGLVLCGSRGPFLFVHDYR